MANPRVITFHSMKGGVGKTTMTVLFASYLAYDLGARVIVYDMDGGQQSLSQLRTEELIRYHKPTVAYSSPTKLNTADRSKYSPPDLRRYHNDKSGIDSFYPILQSSHTEIEEQLEQAKDYDYVLIDMGGRVHEAEHKILSLIDSVFIPMTTQNLDLSAGIKYALILTNLHKMGKLKPNLTTSFYWNRFERWYVSTLLATETKFSESYFGPLHKGFMRNRLKQAPSAFDKSRMLTTISSPFVTETAEKQEEMVCFFDELLGMIK